MAAAPVVVDRRLFAEHAIGDGELFSIMSLIAYRATSFFILRILLEGVVAAFDMTVDPRRYLFLHSDGSGRDLLEGLVAALPEMFKILVLLLELSEVHVVNLPDVHT